MESVPSAPFRYRPPELGDGIVVRPRLLAIMRQRFERRLVVVVGSGGFGKTTLLAHAIENNRVEQLGQDVWLQLSELDSRPDAVLDGIARALGFGDAEAVNGVSVDDVVERVWSLTPEHVALVFDDAHVLDGSASWDLITQLVETLPTNAHVVVGSRTMPPLPVRTLQARGLATVVVEGDLAFTDAEIEEFAQHGGTSLASTPLPSWPALAVLVSTAGADAAPEFVWEVILRRLDPEHLEALALVVRLGQIDDALVVAAAGARWTAARLVAGLPLVETVGASRRFHDLWRTALADVVPPGQWREALVRAAAVLERRGELLRAIACCRDAGADDRIVAIARAFAVSPISAGLSREVAGVLEETLPPEQQRGALGLYLRSLRRGSFESAQVHVDMDEVRDAALASGDAHLASLAVWRSVQLLGDVEPDVLSSDRVAALLAAVDDLAADGWPLARSARALVASHLAEHRHDMSAAIAATAGFDGTDPVVRRSAVNSRLVALGHPELVDATLDDVLRGGLEDPVAAQAVWYRGEIDPTVAWPIVADMPATYSRRMLPNLQVPLLGVLSGVALSAGDVRAARVLVADAAALADRLNARPALFARIADATLALYDRSEAESIALLQRQVDLVALAPSPAWGYLGALCSLRAFIDDTAWLDDIEYGRAMTTAVAAGRALAELRATGDVDRACRLPWQSVDLLRVHVPAPLLVELALAAGNVVAARDCLARVPAAATWSRRVLEHRSQAVRSGAMELATRSPDPPSYRLRIQTFGGLRVTRSDDVAMSDRIRGGRVQQLLARLLVERVPRRSELGGRWWPELTPKQAATNLRVTLASLLDVLEPARVPGSSWFVHSRDGTLQLAHDCVDVDVREFESSVAEAGAAERSGALVTAIEHWSRAAGLYTGDFLAGVDDIDVEHERLRLQTLAYHANLRVAELLLAKGEPEVALRWAIDAIRVDPYAERAHRTVIGCHLALGSSTAARSAAHHLVAMLASAGAAPDRETELLLARVRC